VATIVLLSSGKEIRSGFQACVPAPATHVVIVIV
jgi:hypothetical protein